MKSIKMIFFIVLVIVSASLAIQQQAMAGRACEGSAGNENVWDEWVDGQAAGTKLYGTLAIFYETVCVNSAEHPDCCTGADPFGTNMYFVLRLTKGSDTYKFFGDSGTAIVCAQDYTAQYNVLWDFLKYTVLPEVSPGSTEIALKSIDQVVDLNEPDYSRYYTIMDITLAVQD